MKLVDQNKTVYRVQALERALDILECFSFQNRELSLTDFVNRTGLNKTTVKRLISNLTARGYLKRDPQSKKYQLRISSDIGWRRPLHYGMLGMVLLAGLDSKDVQRILMEYPLEAHTSFSITDDDAFSLRLEQIRDQGYILEKEEAVEGVIGIAAPVRDYSRQVVAALGIAFPISTHNRAAGLNRMVDLVKKTCETISSNLGYLRV